MVGNSSYIMCESFLLVHNWPVVKGAVRCLNCTWHSILSCLLPSGLHPKPLPQNTWTCTVWPHWLPCSSSWECVWAVSLSCYPSWVATLTWRRGLCLPVILDTQQTHGKAPKVIPPLLPSHQGKRLALNIGGRLLNAYFCMILAKALEAVGVEVLDADSSRGDKHISSVTQPYIRWPGIWVDSSWLASYVYVNFSGGICDCDWRRVVAIL